jgi:hypothetical protein
MRILYLDCFSGIAGDMLLGALVDLGVDPGELKRLLRGLDLRGYAISVRKTVRQGISGTKVDVKVTGHQHHRGWKEISGIVGGADLSPSVKEKALRIFRRLIEAEARIHRIPAGKVHLHEVGAVDAIVDVVGSVIGIEELLGADGRLHVSPLHLGGGRVKMAHGTYPVPPPATVALLKGVPVLPGPVDGELVTPTGAAIVSTLASGFGPMPPMTIAGVGYGAGTRQYEGHPNMLRAILGEAASRAETGGEVVVIECTIDDMNPQGYGYLMERLFEAGALDVFYAAVQMKKNRPGTLVTAIGPRERFSAMTSILFRESTTIGVRHHAAARVELAREIVTVRTPYGRLRVKVSSFEGSPVQAQPEYEDCRRIAAAKGIPLKEVQAAALAAFRAGAPAAPRSRPAGKRLRGTKGRATAKAAPARGRSSSKRGKTKRGRS